jgi:hypothetical protein
MPHSFCKLIPSRTSFSADITPVEAQLMQAHVAYWREQMRQGYVLVFGPVADPRAAYGITVLQLPDDLLPATLADADPVISANIGFHYEIHPMRAVLPSSI